MAVTPNQIFDVVADVDNYKHFVPWCRYSKVTKILDAQHFEADLEVGFKVFSERYTSKVTTDEAKLVVSEAADSSVFNYLKFRWEFAPGPTARTTWITFSVDYDFKNALYTQTSSLFFDQVVAKMMRAFDHRCKELYGR
jgi:ribosome-associated toxin RatA of RatAB toxin-antitoxin module